MDKPNITFQCNECKKNFSANNVLRKHVKKFHPSKVDILAPLKKSTKKFDFSCKICNKNFSHKANLKYHIKNNHQDLSLSEIFRGTLKSSQKKICSMCNQDFEDKKQLLNHFYHVIKPAKI